jgi:hypothetical protein
MRRPLVSYVSRHREEHDENDKNNPDVEAQHLRNLWPAAAHPQSMRRAKLRSPAAGTAAMCGIAAGPLWIADATEGIGGGMSGSPILADDGTAIGLLCTSGGTGEVHTEGGPNPRLMCHLPMRFLPPPCPPQSSPAQAQPVGSPPQGRKPPRYCGLAPSTHKAPYGHGEDCRRHLPEPICPISGVIGPIRPVSGGSHWRCPPVLELGITPHCWNWVPIEEGHRIPRSPQQPFQEQNERYNQRHKRKRQEQRMNGTGTRAHHFSSAAKEHACDATPLLVPSANG